MTQYDKLCLSPLSFWYFAKNVTEVSNGNIKLNLQEFSCICTTCSEVC